MEEAAKVNSRVVLITLMTAAVCVAGLFSARFAFAADLPPALPVGVITAKAQTIEITENLPARLESSKDAVVRARVTGIVEERLFKEGAFVKKGDVLFKIDNRSYKATLDSAKGSLARAIAQKNVNQADVVRYRRLVKVKAVSSQLFDQSEATLAVSNADIEIARAAVEQAKINYDYCTVTAPISGFIGKQDVTVGALVSGTSATQMAQILQVNPLYVNVRQSAIKILRLKEQLSKNSQGDDEHPGVQLKIFLEDGTPYKYPGELLFTDVAVDASTGEGSLRASVPNPDGFLMPGLYVRVEIPQMTLQDIFLIPQQAVTRTEKGNMLTVATVDDEAKEMNGHKLYSYETRNVGITSSLKENWVVTDGLKEGETVIVDGMLKVNMMHIPHVIPVPWGVQPGQSAQPQGEEAADPQKQTQK
ncbi:efflux RND transporter periplasmic adaptor subunit [Desulforhopalus vacuolatus]|uniref:efflux RND transporter periplasmic adaptor subunit n=1 Tax=Desulforhopalus vacuolatus TaxID=40414 RepID=UPI001966B3B4|nr:efflux RND transporter periplasmic adaptor subunit [Desulforhopalus vacuolatus]MBM9519523.1 efflux RND transporter periplasmic adaptor subunit [Desulforhopalus vacuolatus]